TVSAQIDGNYSGPGFVCENLTIGTGKSFAPTSPVEIRKDAVCSSELMNGKLIFNGTVVQKFQGYAFDLTLNNSAGMVMEASGTIKGTLKLQTGILSTNGNLILHSSATGTARVATIESGAGITGNVLTRRFVPGTSASWHLMGVPVSGQTVSDWSDDFLILSNFIYRYKESGSINVDDQINGWEQMSGSLNPGQGYRTFLNQSFFNANAPFDNSGPLVTGDFEFPVTFNSSGYDGGGWNLLANPYACEIDWHSFSKNLINGQVHVWNNNKYGSYSEGAGIGINGGSRYLSSFQGFFIKASGTGAELSASEVSKPATPQINTFMRVAADPSDMARITLRGPDGDNDETAIRWIPGTLPSFESFYDADKLINPTISLFSNTQDGRRTSIQARDFYESDIVDLGISVNHAGSYFLELHIGAEIFAGKTWEIRDNETGFIFPLTADMLLPFQVIDGSEYSLYRFSIIAQTPTGTDQVLGSSGKLNLYPNPATESVTVVSKESNAGFVLTDLLGRVVKTGVLDQVGNKTIEISDLSSGIYQLKVGNSISKLEVQ
ncbi:MAG TPA: T9SS type A sorting domain-containing protein, partial [Catalimonadaceae bacterium]|nr:T9SS type A sorting domain-containing protein [Catalimonadaceae bacterium]